MLNPCETPLLYCGGHGRQSWNASIRRVGDDRRSERLHGASPELAKERVVGSGSRAGSRSGIATGNLLFPRRGFLGREEGLVLQLQRTFEWRDGGRVPDAVEIGLLGCGPWALGRPWALGCGKRTENREPEQNEEPEPEPEQEPWNHRLLLPFLLDPCPFKQIHHPIVPFVTRVLVDLLVGLRHRNRDGPLLRKGRRI